MTGLKVVMDEPYAASTIDFAPIVEQDRCVGCRCVSGRWSLRGRRRARAPTLRSASRFEMGVDSGGAGRCEIRGARAGRFGHHSAFTVGTAGVVYAAIWTDQRAVRREISGQVSRRARLPCGVGLRGRSGPAACHRTGRVSRSAKRVGCAQHARFRSSSSVTSDFRATRCATAFRSLTTWSWPSGKWSIDSSAAKSFGRQRHNRPTCSIPSRRRADRPAFLAQTT